MPFPLRLENPHVVHPSQVAVRVLTRSPIGEPLNSSFRSRSSPRYKQQLAVTLQQIARVVPGGMLVFFPSYAAMKGCVEHWQTGGYWSALNSTKVCHDAHKFDSDIYVWVKRHSIQDLVS